MRLIFRTALSLILFLPSAALAQFYVVGLGGASQLSNAASAAAAPLSASNYQAAAGPAVQVAAGYHFNNWVSLQAFDIWNRNRIVTSQVTQGAFTQSTTELRQNAAGADVLIYFRRRSSWIRPYLSGGPAWVRIGSDDRLGFRTAVGADVRIHAGWRFRYSFSEMMSSNPLAQRLTPPAGGLLMNFENVFGFVKTF